MPRGMILFVVDMCTSIPNDIGLKLGVPGVFDIASPISSVRESMYFVMAGPSD